MQLGLAEAYAELGKSSAAFVVVEELLGTHPEHARAHLLHARLLLAADQLPAAREAYATALTYNPTLEDAELASRLRGAKRPSRPTAVHPLLFRAAWAVLPLKTTTSVPLSTPCSADWSGPKLRLPTWAAWKASRRKSG
ncbi:hypothetical protein MUN84_15850 [Hymenobacter sp. 5516J-16]|uniref:tetratricopeptide repeat protein n=1 Tax=Hymenobacter sp. 5516J-16 TaxID=2932253 RepID=UPI001FD5BEC5|nr:hypothetical protein [Hymenobacter sp. 5516J-16]UOQ76068.1 hypothetical protein MUN84_15850 [Hymenobacter sp. 5516J-16]